MNLFKKIGTRLFGREKETKPLIGVWTRDDLIRMYLDCQASQNAATPRPVGGANRGDGEHRRQQEATLSSLRSSAAALTIIGLGSCLMVLAVSFAL